MLRFSLKIILLYSLTGFFIFALSPLIVFGQDYEPEEDSGFPNPLRANTFTELFVGIVNRIVGIVSTLAVLMIIVGGFQYMLSGGSEENIKKARKTIQWSLVGLLIVLSSWSLLKVVLEILGVE